MAETTNIIEFAPFVKFVIEFHNNVMTYAKLLRLKIAKIEALSESEIELIEEAFLIKHIAEYDILVQNLISYCVAMDTKCLSEHLDLDLPKKVTFDTAYSIVNGLNFLSITTTDELKSLAKKIIVEENNPFKLLTKETLNWIDETYIIRNYVAHKSKRSKKRLIKLYKDRYNINVFMPPGQFLRQGEKSKIGNPFRADIYYGAFLSVSTTAWKQLDLKSYKYVFEDEDTEEGIMRGLAKMALVFETITNDNNL